MIPSSMQEENLPNALCNSFHGEYQTHTPICFIFFIWLWAKRGSNPQKYRRRYVFAKLLALIAAPVFMIFKLCTTHLN